MADVIDDKKILNSYYDDRETFVVDFDPKKVSVEVKKDEILFKLKR